MGANNFDLFISYRRNGGEVIARLIFELLKNRKYNIFFDHESLSSGEFENKLIDIIKNCNDYLVMLSNGCFWIEDGHGKIFMNEIKCAVDNGKNIIPIFAKDFIIPSDDEIAAHPYSEYVKKVLGFNGETLEIAHIDSVVDRICTKLKTKRRIGLTTSEVVDECNDFISFLSDKSYADLIPEKIKLSIVNSSIGTLLDEYTSPIIKNVLDRLVTTTYNVRTHFRYEIDISEGFDFKIADIDSDKYYEISENLSYTKIFRIDRPEDYFWISFSTGLTELDSELHNESFFFSENLMLDPEDITLLSELDDADKEKLYLSVMRVKLNINGEVLAPEDIIVDRSGIFAKYKMPSLDVNEPLSVKIRFKAPQKYANSFFFACISEPTYSPFVRVSYDEEVFNVDMIPFLTRSLTSKDTKIFEGVRELSVENEWIMPVSGAIFLINKID